MEESAVEKLEWALIEDKEIQGEDDLSMLARQLQAADHIEILKSDFATRILRTNDNQIENTDEDQLDPEKFIRESLEAWEFSQGIANEVREFQILALGIACLHSFVQLNYTGPFLPFDSLALLPQSLRSQADINAKILSALSIDGEHPYHLTPHPYFLLIASVLLNRPSHLVTAPWWKARVDFLHQRVLGDHSATLFVRIDSAMKEVRDAVERRGSDTKGRHSIEQGVILTYYGQDNKALEIFQKAGKEVGFEWVLTGALGRRTKFQTFDVSQLTVLAKGRDRQAKHTSSEIPITLDLNDDTLLEKISYTSLDDKPDKLAPTDTIPQHLSSLDPNNPTPLHPLDSTILLALTTCIKNTNPSDGLTMEEMTPYVSRVLS